MTEPGIPGGRAALRRPLMARSAGMPTLAAVVVVALLVGWPARGHGTPQDVLQEAVRAYDRSDFRRVIELVRPLLYPRILLSRPELVIRAYKLLGLGHLFEKQAVEAERQFIALLSLRPDYRMDPMVDPVAAVEFFEEFKRKNAEKIRAIQERERKELRRRQEELRIKKEREKRAREARCPRTTVERTVVQHPFWINFVPLGAGQFQNGHRRKGWALLGLQSGLGAVSLGLWISLQAAYPKGSVPAAEWDVAQALSIAQVISGGLCLAAVAYGIIDALVYHQPRTVSEKRSRRTTSLFLTPVGGNGAGGIGLGGVF